MAISAKVAGDHAEQPDSAVQNVLLQACGTGNRLAFEALYRTTSARLFGICLYYLSNHAEAEEVLQEIYTSVWLKASTFDPALSSAGTWMASIARHKAIDRRRARHAHEPLDTVAQWPEQESVLDSVERDHQGSALERCLSTLEEEQQRYIRVAFFEGYSYAELAERHSVPLGTVKSWIRRGLLRLRVCLGL
ncbi:MAG: sigma-70 family RNA polymerase sigma factor [Candidatus Pseudomonas phytovorans]|uniref:Sigma-70 family RNA polymerase sigma factor n=1 Tax=Candidatus Pseudomonas phytovorans TaxID=3121377 RepID=A0AAJ5WLP6_9PSED|nr:sigma-70 family RNA polymerase sigma factor [Pseudomonas sp.]WEK32941.1 MAG: sigma-70 family RNA polymerase sigma factor [Pseudomonas sp.]